MSSEKCVIHRASHKVQSANGALIAKLHLQITQIGLRIAAKVNNTSGKYV